MVLAELKTEGLVSGRRQVESPQLFPKTPTKLKVRPSFKEVLWIAQGLQLWHLYLALLAKIQATKSLNVLHFYSVRCPLVKSIGLRSPNETSPILYKVGDLTSCLVKNNATTFRGQQLCLVTAYVRLADLESTWMRKLVSGLGTLLILLLFWPLSTTGPTVLVAR